MYVIGKGTTILQVVPLLLKIKIAKLVAHCYNIDRETKEPGGLPSYFGGVNPPDARKEGVANVCYICGLDPNWNIHCNPYRAVLHSLQGKTKIAAITRNNDG